MTKQAVIEVENRHLIAVRLWTDGSATLVVTDGATVPEKDMAEVLEAMAQFVRTGALGKLPQCARVVTSG